MKDELLPQWLSLLQHLSQSRNCGTPLGLCFHCLKVQDEILGYKINTCESWEQQGAVGWARLLVGRGGGLGAVAWWSL